MNQDSNRTLWIVLAIVFVLGAALCSAVVLIGVALNADGTSFGNLPPLNFTPDVLFNLIFILLFTLPLIFMVFTIQKRIRGVGQIVQQKTGHSLPDMMKILREQNFTNPNDTFQFLQTRFNLSEEDVRAILATLSSRDRNDQRRGLDTQPMDKNPARNRMVGFVLIFVLIDLLIFGGIAVFWFLSR
ncbi:MAG: hypothetical protein OHK0052_10940 [Anaerolineales bacterium]